MSQQPVFRHHGLTGSLTGNGSLRGQMNVLVPGGENRRSGRVFDCGLCCRSGINSLEKIEIANQYCRPWVEQSRKRPMVFFYAQVFPGMGGVGVRMNGADRDGERCGGGWDDGRESK